MNTQAQKVVDELNVGDEFIALFSWSAGWPYFAGFELIEKKDGYVIGIHRPNTAGLNWLNENTFEDKIDIWRILPKDRENELRTAWNSYYANGSHDSADKVYETGYFVRDVICKEYRNVVYGC